MEISKYELCVPWGDYQRDRTESSRAKEIAIDWNWAALGCLSVIVRSDGSNVVADGGTRLSAAYFRPDINMLPCMVYEVDDQKTEAEIFRKINVNRDRLKIHELHKAELFEGRDMAIEAQNYMDELQKAGVQFDSLARLKRKIERSDRAHTLRLLPVFKKIASGRVLSAKCFTGLVFVERSLSKVDQSLTQRPYITRLCRVGSHGIDTAIAGSIPYKSGGGTSRVYGQVIMNMLKIKV